MLSLTEGEKNVLRDGTNGTFWQVLRRLLEDAIHEESLQQLQCDPTNTMMIARFKYRREALEEYVKAPYELSK